MPRLAVLVTAAGLALLAGCSVGTPSGFVARSNHTCDEANERIAALKPPADATAELAYALDRYTAVERAVSTLTTASLPGGSSGAELRGRWLRPARTSLRTGDDDLDRLRRAVRDGDATAAESAFGAALSAGARGVDTSLLRARGLSGCATLFMPTAPPQIAP